MTMNALKCYRARYEEQLDWYEDKKSKYEWAATDIFGLSTYDSELDERFVKDILEVCKVILEKRNFEYIESSETDYIKYILVCQLLDRLGWLSWGTSIRGAWFEEHRSHYRKPDDIYDGCGCHDKRIPFTIDNLKALIKFMEETND